MLKTFYPPRNPLSRGSPCVTRTVWRCRVTYGSVSSHNEWDHFLTLSDITLDGKQSKCQLLINRVDLRRQMLSTMLNQSGHVVVDVKSSVHPSILPSFYPSIHVHYDCSFNQIKIQPRFSKCVLTGTGQTHASLVKVSCTVCTGTRMMGAFALMNFCLVVFFVFWVCEQMDWKFTLKPQQTRHWKSILDVRHVDWKKTLQSFNSLHPINVQLANYCLMHFALR